MENNSLIQGTTWHWRNTYMHLPIHSYRHLSGNIKVQELCVVVNDTEQRQQLAEELRKAQIHIATKEVHLGSDNIPEGSTILYVRKPNEQIEDEEGDFESSDENLKRLKNYIFQNGGKIDGEMAPLPIKKISFSLFNLFRRERRK